MELKLGTVVSEDTLPTARRAGKYDTIIEQAEKTLKEGQALPIVGVTETKLDSVGLAIRGRIKALNKNVHVRRSGKTLYFVHGKPPAYTGKPRGRPKK